MLLLLLRLFSRVRLCVTPQTAAHQAPPSLGFSRQEHWSGLPFPSPMQESEKWKWSWLSHIRLLATPWTAAHQAPPPTGFARQEYRSGVPLPSPSFMQNLPHYQPPSPGCTVISVDKPAYHFMANRWGNNGNWETLFSWAPKSLQMGTAAMKLKDACSLEERLWPT